MDPARMLKESLTSRPELENSQGQQRTSRPSCGMSVLPPATDLKRPLRHHSISLGVIDTAHARTLNTAFAGAGS